MRNDVRKLTLCAVLTAAALVTFVIELQLPPLTGIPGIKPGLANIFTLFALCWLGRGWALALMAVRVALGCIVTGRMTALGYSLAGGLLFALVQIGKDGQQMRLRHGAAIKPHYGAYHLLICRTLGAHKRLKNLGNACQTIAHPLGGNNGRLTAMANDLSQMNNKLLSVIRDNRRILRNKRRGRCSGSMCAPTRNGHRFTVGTGRGAARDSYRLAVGARSARHRDSFACRRSTRA